MNIKRVIIFGLMVIIFIEIGMIINKKINNELLEEAEQKKMLEKKEYEEKELDKENAEYEKDWHPIDYKQEIDDRKYLEGFENLYEHFSSYEEALKAQDDISKYLISKGEEDIYWQVTDEYFEEEKLGFTLTSENGSIYFVQIEADKTQIAKIK